MAEYGTTLRTVSFLKVLLVVALSKGQDDFPRLDDMNSFLGEPFTITCPEGLPTFRWFKGQDNNKDKQVALVVPSASIARCEGEFANRDCSISMETGDLTLGSVWIEDEGSYVCQKLFSGGPASQYRLKLLNVNVNPTDVNMTELKSPFPKPGEDFQITCTVERIRPANARVYFKLMRNGQAGPEINGLTDTVPNGDGTFKLTTTVQMKFNRTDDGERFRCIVHPQSGRGNKVTKDRKIFVRWEYKTEVQETDHDEKPIVGQSKRLSCYNSEENKGNPEAKQNDVRWMHNGHTVQNDARHDGASTRNLTINQLQKTDAGEYRCAISNRAGPGESLSDFYLRIWVAHTSKVQEATASEVPLVGSKKQLVCYRDKHGFPEEVKAVRWYKDGERISKMYQKYQISDYYLYIENLERSDAGKYTCHLVNEAGEGTSDEPYALNVYWAPEGQPRIKPASSVVGVKSGITLTCSTDEMDEGNPPSYYTIWTKHNDESFHRNKTGNKLQLWDIKSVTDGGRFYCKVGNMIGTSSVSQDVTVTVEAPVHIEELNPSDSQTVVYDDKTFEISCTASGSNINKVTWYKDGQPLDGKNNFRIWELETVEGNFKYGQTQAVESFLERQPKNLEFDCSNVNYYSGEYKCRMEGTMAGVTTSAESESVTIDTIYPALWAGKEKLTSASRDDESKQIVCDVCAEPPVDSFSWLFNGRSLRGGIEQNVNTLTIDRVFTDDFGVYTCTAKSDINGRWIYRTFDIELTERGKPHEPKDFEVVMQTSISVTVRWKAGFAAGYEPQAFRLEYRETTESEFEVYRENIPETNGWITETIMRLAPSSNYDIRLRAINRRPVMPNHSDYVSVEAKTKALPRVELTKVDVTETKIQVQWNFKSKGRSKRAVDEGYSVGVQIKYKKQSDKEYLTYPEDGNKLPADQESAVINGTFNIHEPYIVRIFVFEDDLQVESVSTESFKSSPLPKPVTASSTGGIIGGVIAVLVVIIIAAVLFILYKRRQHRKRTKGRNLELAGGKTNQRSSAGYSPLANHHEEIPHRYTCGPGQVNGDKPYMNVDELNGHGGYDEASSADNLYESVDNHPGSVRKCPAGPPPPPAEEPLYSKPNKKKNKKDKKDKEAKEPQAAKENPYANTTNGALGDNPYQNVDYKKSASQEDLYDDVASPQSGGSQEDLTKTGEEIVYADLDIKPDAKKPKKKKKPVVNQSEPATEYAVIDFTKKAPPAADDDDDDDDEC